jgi:hypothetical protein
MAYSEKQIEDTFTEICRQIAEEGKSLRAVLRSKEMPESHTFYKWIDNDTNKLLQYTRATNDRAEGLFDEILQISDTTIEGTTTKETENGIEVTTADMIQHRRLQVDSRKWMLGKMNPKKYSDKIQIDQSEFSEQPLFPDVPTDDSNQ